MTTPLSASAPKPASPVRKTPSCSFQIPGVNTTEALPRFAGDERRYQHWLIEFVTHGPAAATQIREAITNGSQDVALKLVHSLKGRTGMLGLLELHSITLSLEDTLKNNEPSAVWMDELDRTTEEVSRAIAAVLSNGSP